jgi:hypothetical protein
MNAQMLPLNLTVPDPTTTSIPATSGSLPPDALKRNRVAMDAWAGAD